MLLKATLICVILGTVSSEPLLKSVIIPNDIITPLINDYISRFQMSLRPETIKVMGNLVKSAVGLKLSALEIVLKIVPWFTSNLMSIAIGSIMAFGICKITGKCSLNYDHALSKIYSVIITPEQLEMTQNLLASALRRYRQEDEGKEEESKEKKEKRDKKEKVEKDEKLEEVEVDNDVNDGDYE